jgi:hypothetical protein
MKESYRKGVANHPDLELCAEHRDVLGEALDRGTDRQGIELRNQCRPGCRRCSVKRKATPKAAKSTRVVDGPRAVRGPRHVWKFHAREPGDPRGVRRRADRPEKPKAQVRDERLWGVERPHSTDEACEQEAGDCQAERVEGRRSAEANPRHGPMLDTAPENTGAL